jgi:hypothetical protein
VGIVSFATYFAIVAFVAFVAGALFGRRYGKPRYRSPQLHEGNWHPGLARSDARTWHRDGLPYTVAPLPPKAHQCAAQTCTLAKGLAHEDRCACGATRYGIYGIWERVNLRWTIRETSS